MNPNTHTNLARQDVAGTESLLDAVSDLVDLERTGGAATDYSDFAMRLGDLLAEISGCELQTWPRGYPGDFETIEMICAGVNGSRPGTLAHHVESWALQCPPVQQHRNKVSRQAALIHHCIASRFGRRPVRICSIASGPSRDLREVANKIDIPRNTRIVLNDIDEAALQFSRARLGPLADQCTFVHANALMQARTLAHHGAFDLILVGGLCDYLTDRQCDVLIRALFRALRDQGTLFFTNIADGNPYRGCMEYLIDWQLIERSEADIWDICGRGGSGWNTSTSRAMQPASR